MKKELTYVPSQPENQDVYCSHPAGDHSDGWDARIESFSRVG
jgi:hypothetical protein